jgi:hypothetical protein
VGDFYAEEERDVVFEIKLATPTSPTNKPIPHATISLAYTDTLEKRLVQSDDVVCTIVRPMGTEISKENPHVAAQWLRVYAANQMAQAERLASQKQFREARCSLQQWSHEYYRHSAEVQAYELSPRVLASVREVEQTLDDQDSYDSKGAKLMSSAIRSHQIQRSAAVSDDSAVYKNKRKDAFSSYFTFK